MSGDEVEAVVSAWRVAPMDAPACTVSTALDVVACLMAQRDALAAAMPSEGADAALAYAVARTERDEARAVVWRLRSALAVAYEWMAAEGENGDGVPDEFCTPAYQEARRVVREALA